VTLVPGPFRSLRAYAGSRGSAVACGAYVHAPVPDEPVLRVSVAWRERAFAEEWVLVREERGSVESARVRELQEPVLERVQRSEPEEEAVRWGREVPARVREQGPEGAQVSVH
jgi:hypothetical protein